MTPQVMWILCDVWILCLRVEVNIQQRVVCFREKASLRICCIILFECKAPCMLKTEGRLKTRKFWKDFSEFFKSVFLILAVVGQNRKPKIS